MNLDKFPHNSKSPLEGELLDPEELDPEFLRKMTELPEVVANFYITAAKDTKLLKILYGSTDYFVDKTNQELVDKFLSVNPEYKTILEQMKEIDMLDKGDTPIFAQYHRDPFDDARDITPQNETPIISTNENKLPKP
ncbi:hypothetical protein H6784_05400 [Candidatus Nomurabacteria bacterium]|nr:hypothetical protein [Candidatus Kaiserbacteria bacterium]MCB9814815.1 hypothetical protein [Candidatus Nomurabacteria bacterium]